MLTSIVPGMPSEDPAKREAGMRLALGAALHFAKRSLRPGLHAWLRRSDWLAARYAGVKGFLEEREMARWGRFYEREAASRGLNIPGPAELRAAVRSRLLLRGVRPSPKARGALHVFVADRFGPFDDQDFITCLRGFGKVSVFSWGALGFDHQSRHWLSRRADMNRAMLDAFERADREQPIDAVIGYFSGYTTDPETMHAMGRRNAVTINICFDDVNTFPGPWVGGRWYSAAALAPVVDLTLTGSPRSIVKYMVHGGLAKFWPVAALQVGPPPGGFFRFDVSFVGQRYGRRPAFINALRREGIDVATFGAGWENGPLPREELQRVFRESRISLGFSVSGNSATIMHLKGRDFQVPACGGLYLTNHHSDLASVFVLGREIMTYQHAGDCASTIRWLLNHPEEAAKIREAGWKRVAAEHTWDQRFQEVFELVGILTRN